MSCKGSDLHDRIFREGSKTYYTASLFFPESVKRDVFLLYGFVRVADNFVDQLPQDAEGFFSFCRRYRQAWALGPGASTEDPVIDGFIDLARRKNFDPAWIDAFLRSMEWDLTRREYDRIEDTLEYIYGSAEVIGLCMAAILELPESAHQSARALGRSMQYINFIRDINEDLGLGRRYLPLEGTSLKSLTAEEARARPGEFAAFLRAQSRLYRVWQREGEAGYPYLPRRVLIAVKTASDMYNWTASRIMKDPFLVYRRTIKPSRLRILARAFLNTWIVLFHRPHRRGAAGRSGAAASAAADTTAGAPARST
ncbi:phytoene/squalene synthase family protein [Alkalispirochaeta alkalica]|uniref:phytoene/squalene synthase family protein n=1 Tax=Alkalispirochaeta alkalica TaxID=46356 RepID=UPI000370F894|nr:phytoene/squalene synthase family protein [Alkalispirochaeta alkalica]